LSVLRTMFHTKTLVTQADQDFLPAVPQTADAREPKQRRLMAVSLALLVIALAFVLYQDRDFWFPDTPDAEDQLGPVPEINSPAEQTAKAAEQTAKAAEQTPKVAEQTGKTIAPPPAATVTKATPTAGGKPHSLKAHAKASAPAATPVAHPASTVAAANLPAAPTAPPLTATTTRTVLPPLEVEVVAGDNHRTVRPGTNSVHVDLQAGSAPRTVANAPAATAPATAAGVTSNAAERVQMSAGTAEVVSQPVNPGYPMLARQMKVQGSVILQALIGRDGTIQDLHVVSGPTILSDAAQDAVRQWRFKPHYVGSEAVETQAKITVNFTISTN
jgi:periplasmic protein TonB